jgi:DNA adenine methylase
MENMMSNPIIPWLGGKRRLADRLIPLFPKHECYVEGFCGGAALFFLRPVPAKCEVINDINGDLINLYRVVQRHPDEFERQFRWALSSRDVFLRMQSTRPESLTDIQRAARFFYLQQHAFGGHVDGQTFGTATTGQVVNWPRIMESLSAAHQRLAGVTIEHLPWQKVIERYDRAHTFFYLDPPYWETEGYGVDFDIDQYHEMADLMRKVQGRVMVSINNHPEIRRIYAGFWMESLDICYSAGNSRVSERKSTGELVICNWDASTEGGLF